MITPDELRRLSLFTSLGEESLAWLAQEAAEVYVKAGDTLFEEGDPARGFYVVLDGEIRVTRQVDGEEMVLASREAGMFVGEISLLAGTPHTASVRAVRDSRLLHMNADTFQRMLATCSTVAGTILRASAERMQANEEWLQHREKLVALGSLAAGLAHELNNPAAAACRSARQLRETLTAMQRLVFQLHKLGLSPEQLDELEAYQYRLLEQRSRPLLLDPVARSDREEALAAWMTAHGIEEGWKLAPPLVAAGVDLDQLDRVAARAGSGDVLHKVLAWLEGTLTVSGLVGTLEQSSSRLSNLVNRFKAYSYLDQAPLQAVDVHEGLENTLSVLAYKIEAGVAVIRNYDLALPRINGYGSELNQVWTNLIDNALDALDGQGELRLRTAREDDHVLVEIADSGPGIPPEVRTRIFEPFFTTKSMGKGTGLGLDIAYRIVVSRHHGDLRVESQPGDTRFQARLPINHPH